MSEYTILDYIIGTAIVFVLLASIEAGNILAAIGWGFTLFWFHMYIVKTVRVKIIRRK